MYRFAILYFVGVAILVKAEIHPRKCFEAMTFGPPCCAINCTDEKMAIMKECFESTVLGPHSCELEMCYGEKAGFILSNGTVDKTMLEATLEKEFENNTDILEIVKEKCLLDDLSKYGPTCYVKQMRNCLRIYTALNCPKWKDTERCNKVKEISEECKSLFT